MEDLSQLAYKIQIKFASRSSASLLCLGASCAYELPMVRLAKSGNLGEKPKEQTKPNNSAETEAEAEYSASFKGSRSVLLKIRFRLDRNRI